MKAAPGMDYAEFSSEIHNITKTAPSYLVKFKNNMDTNDVKTITGLNNIREMWKPYRPFAMP